MKFCEAMEKLESGEKVTRKPWNEGIYFLLVDGDVKSFQPKISSYIYNEDIMVSDGWIVDGVDIEMKFCEIIPYLKNGFKARMWDWGDKYIYYDSSIKNLAIHSMDCFKFFPDFDSFLAEDWIVAL